MRPARLAIAVIITSQLVVAARATAAPRTHPDPAAVLAEPAAAPDRVHVERMGAVALVPGGATTDDGGHQLGRMLELPVVDERGPLVRVLVEHDHARTLVWVHADELAWSIARPVRLAGKGDAGIWLTTGAPVAVTGKGKRRTVRFDNASVRVTGTVAAGQLTRVFAVSAPIEPTFGSTAPDLRVAPGGAVLYAQALSVDVVGQRGAWDEVEHRSGYVRIRGWVEHARLDSGLLGTFGTGGGSGYGMSDTAQVTVPAGACLYDELGGKMVGVQLTTGLRYVSRHRGDWWLVYVGTPWGKLEAWGQAVGTDATGAPLWQRCPAAP